MQDIFKELGQMFQYPPMPVKKEPTRSPENHLVPVIKNLLGSDMAYSLDETAEMAFAYANHHNMGLRFEDITTLINEIVIAD